VIKATFSHRTQSLQLNALLNGNFGRHVQKKAEVDLRQKSVSGLLAYRFESTHAVGLARRIFPRVLRWAG
jgi:hypothetical protein